MISSEILPTVRGIAEAIERFAPLSLQETYDNAGIQVGDPAQTVTGVLICLDVTEQILREARQRKCNLIVSHHPLLFKGLKEITGATPEQRIVIEALRHNIAIYSAHTNLDAASDGVSYEMAGILGLSNCKPLFPKEEGSFCGLGVVGDISPRPAMEFLRMVKEAFDVRSLRYSAGSPQLVIRRVAVCGGSGASFIPVAIKAKADVFVTADIKYHDFTTFANKILIADIGHYESELCSRKILSRLIRDSFPSCQTLFAQSESNPIVCL